MRKAAIASLTVLIILLTAGVVWADYIGPQRTVTTRVWRRLHCHYQAIYDPPGAGWYGCYLDLYQTSDSTCPSTGSVVGYFNPGYCSWPSDYCQNPGCSISLSSSTEGCSEGQTGCSAVEESVTYPPASVSGSVTCAVPGSNSWCLGGGALELSASEPLAGYVITTIEGSAGVLCDPPDAASVSCTCGGGGEGNISIDFWAHSSYGDTSNKSSVSWKQDTVGPVSRFSNPSEGSTVVGTEPLNLSGTSTDAASGVAAAEISFDGGGSWSPLAVSGGNWSTSWDPRTAGGGSYAVLARASDQAGNLGPEARITVVVGAEVKGPQVNLPDQWYIWESVRLQVKAGTLAVDKVKLTIDGGTHGKREYTWKGGAVPGTFLWDRYLGDVMAPPGKYAAVLEAWDAAGNKASDRGVILFPEPPTETPTATATMTPTVTPTETALPTEKPLPTRTSEPTASATPREVAQVIVEAQEQGGGKIEAIEAVEIPTEAEIPWVPLAATTCIAAIASLAAAFDPRPPSWIRLADIRRRAFEAEELRKWR